MIKLLRSIFNDHTVFSRFGLVFFLLGSSLVFLGSIQLFRDNSLIGVVFVYLGSCFTAVGLVLISTFFLEHTVVFKTLNKSLGHNYFLNISDDQDVKIKIKLNNELDKDPIFFTINVSKKRFNFY